MADLRVNQDLNSHIYMKNEEKDVIYYSIKI